MAEQGMRHLGLSGGGTKIGGIFGACEVLMREKGYRPHVISGISAGAILCVPLALGKWDAVKQIVLNYNLRTFFSVPPIRENGKVRLANALVRLVGRKRSLGEQSALKETLAKVVTESDFERYINDKTCADCVVGTVDFYTAGRLYINLKTVSYDMFLKLVNASASIPVFTPGIEINEPITDFEGNTTKGKLLLYDGGVRDHIGTPRMLESNWPISETVSIFSRPANYDLLPHNFEAKNVLAVLNRYVEITNVEISKQDEFESVERAVNERVVLHPGIYLPPVMDNVYDVSPQHLQAIYQAGRQAAAKWEPANPLTL